MLYMRDSTYLHNGHVFGVGEIHSVFYDGAPYYMKVLRRWKSKEEETDMEMKHARVRIYNEQTLELDLIMINEYWRIDGSMERLRRQNIDLFFADAVA